MLPSKLLGGYKSPFLAQKLVKNLSFLRYTHKAPFFWAQTNSTQWDHNIHISWGNSGYLWFFGRWPFGIWYQKCILYHCIAWHCMILHGIALYVMVLQSFACHCIVSHVIVLILPCNTVLHCWLRRAGCILQDIYFIEEHIVCHYKRVCLTVFWTDLDPQKSSHGTGCKNHKRAFFLETPWI